MRICIYGAGAGGGHFAVRLQQAGHDVSVVARGDNLAAIRADGLKLVAAGEESTAHPLASDDPADLGIQDLVIVTVKATALASVASGLTPLVGPETLVLFTQNGMPWWYPIGLAAGDAIPPRLPSFALSEQFLRTMPAESILGGLIYSANEMRAPGIVVNNSPGANRIDIAAITMPPRTNVEPVRQAFRDAGIASPEVTDIRAAIWKKLLFNMSGSVIALATGNKSSISKHDAALGVIYQRIVTEGLEIAAAYGYSLHSELVPEEMLRKTLDHKPSLLQDYEQRRPMEINEIVLAPVEFARAAGIPAPTLETIAAIVARLARDRGLLA